METKTLINELRKKRADYVEKLAKFDAAITALEALNGELLEPKKSWITHKEPGAERYFLDKPEIRAFATSYIRKKGAEVSLEELFEAYNKQIGYKINGKAERKLLRSRFCATFQHCEKYGLVKKLFSIQGLGRQCYVNVDSAIKIQMEKTVQNPNVTITSMKLTQ